MIRYLLIYYKISFIPTPFYATVISHYNTYTHTHTKPVCYFAWETWLCSVQKWFSLWVCKTLQKYTYIYAYTKIILMPPKYQIIVVSVLCFFFIALSITFQFITIVVFFLAMDKFSLSPLRSRKSDHYWCHNSWKSANYREQYRKEPITNELNQCKHTINCTKNYFSKLGDQYYFCGVYVYVSAELRARGEPIYISTYGLLE